MDDARILKQVDGLDMHMEHEHILNKYDFTDWNEARRMLNLRPACLRFLKDKLKKAGWVVAVEVMNKESGPEDPYGVFVVAHVLE